MMRKLKDVQLVLSNMESNFEQIDEFSFIDNLQTTVRQLGVFSAIIVHLNNKQLPKKILEQLLIAWSAEEEERNLKYKNDKGKITENGLKTAALGYYIQISTSLGFTTRFNNVYMNTKMSQTFLYFLLNKNDHSERLSVCEKIFYLYMLLENDADGMLLCLSQLINSSPKKQSLLQTQFKEAMSARLLSKMEISPQTIKTKISVKYRAINFIWKKSKKYAEHIIAPRYEWLSNLELVEIKRDLKDTLYSLSEKGKTLYSLIPDFNAEGLKDINKKWINNSFFSVCNIIFNNDKSLIYSNLTIEKQNLEIGESLFNATKAVKSSLSFKLPVKETFLFIGLDLLINKNILINFIDIQNKLKNNFIYNSRRYLLKLAGRPNEGYITITLEK